jgi:diguanylate cyclase (GGDEF)-like protein
MMRSAHEAHEQIRASSGVPGSHGAEPPATINTARALARGQGGLGRRLAAWPVGLGHHLGSSVGRRLCLLFIIAALVPVTLMAAMSFLQSAEAQREQNDVALVTHARAFGATVLARLLWTESLLAVAAGGKDPAARLASRVGHELAGFALFDRRGQPLTPPSDLKPLEEIEPSYLISGQAERRTSLRVESKNGTTILVHAVSAPGEIGFVAAALSPKFLFGARPSLPDVRLCVTTSKGERLFCSQTIADETLWRLSVVPPSGERLAHFEEDGATLRTGAVRVDIDQRFNGPSLTVVAAQPEMELPGLVDAFGTRFVIVLLGSIALALALTVGQVRRILEPLQGLRAGTRRVAARDFGTPVPVEHNDEFGQMAHAFNAMTDQLGLHVRTLQALSVIDRTILTNVDVHQVTELALSCIQEITGVKVVGIGISGAISRKRSHIYIRSGEQKTIREELPNPLPLSDEDPAEGRWSRSTGLPERFRQAMEEQGTRFFQLLPISRAEKTWGVVALGHDCELPLTSDQTLGLAGAIDRLAVALSSVARDKQLYEQAHYDSLTQLPNRHYLMIMLKQLLAQAQRERRSLAVLYIDLDRFKRTNDTLGHAAGDIMLKLAAGRIRRAVRNADIVARLGGDEFTVLLPNLKSANDAGRIARTLIAALSEPFDIDGHVMYAGGSVGIAMYPNDGDSAAELLKKADTALYLAKDRGRGRYAFFEEQMNVDASARATIDRELREALVRGEFRLHYQPQIDLATGEVCAIEALLRWQHPLRGLLAPAMFIEHAEDSGLIEAVGNWVLREACQQHRRWADSGLVIPRISINVSALQLRDRMFAATVEGALASSTTEPSHLEIEVTESLFLDAGPDAVATLERLREKGVEIAVDDFGTGYSSFAYVKQLPARVLKLDRSFIIDVVNNHEAAIIAAAIIEMAHALGKTVVAEGVETEQQAQFLRRLKCARAQGFVFSASLPPDQIPAFVRGRKTYPPALPRSNPLMLVHPQPEATTA